MKIMSSNILAFIKNLPFKKIYKVTATTIIMTWLGAIVCSMIMFWWTMLIGGHEIPMISGLQKALEHGDMVDFYFRLMMDLIGIGIITFYSSFILRRFKYVPKLVSFIYRKL